MLLIRFDGNKTGLVVNLASGIHVVDVIASVGALALEDPISHGILNGLLKSNTSWAQLLEHWEMARKGLRRLAVLAQATGATQVVLFRLDEVRCVSAHPPNGIGSLDIREAEVRLPLLHSQRQACQSEEINSKAEIGVELRC